MVKHQTEANLPVENLTNKQTNKQTKRNGTDQNASKCYIHSQPSSKYPTGTHTYTREVKVWPIQILTRGCVGTGTSESRRVRGPGQGGLALGFGHDRNCPPKNGWFFRSCLDTGHLSNSSRENCSLSICECSSHPFWTETSTLSWGERCDLD